MITVCCLLISDFINLRNLVMCVSLICSVVVIGLKADRSNQFFCFARSRQDLITRLVQRYLNKQKEMHVVRTVSVGDLDSITQQLKELKQMNRLLLQNAYGDDTSLVSATAVNSRT